MVSWSIAAPGLRKEKPKPWKEVPRPSKNVLRDRMTQMYWLGVSREILLLIRTLRAWQQERYVGVHGDDEVLQAKDMEGFKAFLERACGKGRAEHEKDAIQETIYEMERRARLLSVDQRRAQMLLEGAGFLDICKLMEYRPPLKEYGLWARPRAAQLATVNSDGTSHMPDFRPSVCSSEDCSSVIRGTEFRCLNGCHRPNQNRPSEERLVICETCMRNGKHKIDHLRKYEKRCILQEVVSPMKSRQICTCRYAPTSGNSGNEDTRFAISRVRKHLRDCPVLQLKRRYEQAKRDELRHHHHMVDSPKTQKARIFRFNISPLFPRGGKKDHKQGKATHVGTRAVGWAAKSMPPPIQFGNVHMALMVGPIIIENGYPDSQRGARISLREPPQLTMVASQRRGEDFLLCVSEKKKIFQKCDVQPKRRIKACMKQVIGCAFTGLSDELTELEIIDALVEQSRICAYDPMRTEAYDDKRLQQAAKRITDRLRALLGERASKYFDVLASKLFTVELRYDVINNHCQQFCANILDFRAFGSFFATTSACRLHVPQKPLYLMSFVCPPGSYDSPRRVRPKSKKQAPNGLTEEYLLRFRQYGHHEESDIVDTLLEYWHDWGAFGGPLYKYQDLFPWDCTEAYRMGEAETGGKCNDCSMTKHVWSLPFDAWSMVQLHMCRNKYMYSPPHGSTRTTLSDPEWMHNRLTVLSALKALNAVAVAMAKTHSFRASCRWNHERKYLTPDIASRLDRVKLSGIYRAQPKSHNFEKGKYHDCTLAHWALLAREEQIREYERLRDYRAEQLTDIPPQKKGNGPRAVLPRDTTTNSRDDAGNEAPDLYHHDGDQDRDHDWDHDEARYSDGDELNDTNVDPEDSVQETDSEDGGGLIPDTFGPDPDDNYNHSQDDVDAPCGCDDDVNWRDDEGDVLERCGDSDQRNSWNNDNSNYWNNDNGNYLNDDDGNYWNNDNGNYSNNDNDNYWNNDNGNSWNNDNGNYSNNDNDNYWNNDNGNFWNNDNGNYSNNDNDDYWNNDNGNFWNNDNSNYSNNGNDDYWNNDNGDYWNNDNGDSWNNDNGDSWNNNGDY